VSNWNPGPGGGADPSKMAKLMSTEASDAKDTMTGTNELKPFTGSGGKPKGPFGKKGKNF
jgi:hypothetical protein